MSNRPEDEFPESEGPQGKEPHEMKPQDERSHQEKSHEAAARDRAAQKENSHSETAEEEVRWDERLSREIAKREQQIREIWQRRRHKLAESRHTDKEGQVTNESAGHEGHSGGASGGGEETKRSSDDWARRGETRSAEHESEGHAWRGVLGSDLSWGNESREDAHEEDEKSGQSDTVFDASARSQSTESGAGPHDAGAERDDAERELEAEEWHGDASRAEAANNFAELKSRLSFERGAPLGKLLRPAKDENARPAAQDHFTEKLQEAHSGDKASRLRFGRGASFGDSLRTGQEKGRAEQGQFSAKFEGAHSDEEESRGAESGETAAHGRKWRGILQNTLFEDEGAAETRSEAVGAARGRVPRVLIRIGGGKVFSRVAIVLLLLCSIAVGAAAGLLFVYSSDLPQIQELENYRPDVVTEVYADDGSSIGSFALQRRILLTYEQIPKELRDAIISTEDRHFMDHWGIDFPRVAEAAWTDMMHRRVIQGASTITMQLAGGLFLNRADRSFRRKIEEAMLAVQIERHYTKQQIFTMYCNQVYLWNGNYGVEAASEFYFGKPVGELTLAQSALLAGMIRGPIYSPTSYPKRALERRNLVLDLMADNGAISRRDANAAKQTELGLNITYPQNNTLAPYYVEDIRQKLEAQFGTEAVHQEGLRVYSTLDARMQRDAVEALRDGLHAYDRRHGWRGNLPNIFHEHLGTLTSYESPEWRNAIAPGDYVTGLIVAVDKHAAVAKVGPYRAVIAPQNFAWTGMKDPEQLLQVGDLANLLIESIDSSAAKVELEQVPAAQAALVAIDNATGEVKAMVGGYNFQDSKFNRAVQAMRQTGSSFKVYVYATALEQGMSPFDTVLDEPVTYMVGATAYSPHNYDERFEGRISLRRALADSRNVPAVRILQQVGIQNVIDNARKFGITSPLPPYLPLALGAADLTLLEHTSAFSTFPDDGIHIQPHMIRRVTSYDGAILEETRPKVTDVIPPDVARTMTAMLEDVVNFGTGVRARALGRPSAGKTGTTNDFTDAWYIGFTPQITTGVWVGFDDPKSSLGKGETGARAALPIWLEFMEKAGKGMPVESFPNVMPLEQLVKSANEQVDVPDTAPPADTTEQGIPASAGKPNANPQKQAAPVAPVKPAGKPGAASGSAGTAGAIPH